MRSRFLTVLLLAILLLVSFQPADAGVITANGWYEGEEIYYIDLGPEANVTERGPNQI